MSSGPCAGDRVGERDDLGRVAQVDADDPQPVQPVGAVRHRGEAAHRVVREAGGDRRVRAVAQQPQRDVHADLGAAAGEQRAPAGQVGAGVALGVVDRGAVRAELVVERVDLACSRSCRCSRPAGRSSVPALAPAAVDDRAGGPAVSSSMRPGAPVAVASSDRAVGGGLAVASLVAAHPLELLEHVPDGALHRDRIRVVGREPARQIENAEACVEVGGIDPLGSECVGECRCNVAVGVHVPFSGVR